MAKLKQVGWKEVISLPELGLFVIPAKVDTGAKTSVLHCSEVKLLKKSRKKFVEFRPLDERYQLESSPLTLPLHSERKIRNSFGQEETRYVIKTALTIFGKTHKIELSLRDRSQMEFPVLLGRSFISNLFLVNVSKSNLSLRRKKASKPQQT